MNLFAQEKERDRCAHCQSKFSSQISVMDSSTIKIRIITTEV